MPNYNSTLQTNNSSLEEIITQLNNMPDAGNSLDTSDATATAGDILNGKTAYVDGEKITGTIATKTASNLTANGATVTVPAGYYSAQASKAVSTATQATPTVTINTNTGLITATATQTAGYVAAGTKSGTKQLAFQAAQTITPGTTDKTIAANTYLGGTQTIKGDANLVASNIVSGKSIFGVVGNYAGGSGGDTSTEDGLITRTLTTYTNDRVTSIGSGAFYGCTKLKMASGVAVKTIGDLAFARCDSLTNVNFPVATQIGSSAFHFLTSLYSVNAPLVTTIGNSAFTSCYSLSTINFPEVTVLGREALRQCYFSVADFPKLVSIGNSAFRFCSSITSTNFPVVQSIGDRAFEGCYKLTQISFPACTKVGSYAFGSCSSLASIYLGASTLCALSNSNAFSKAGITSTTGSIFVPASLLAFYKAATNWAFFSARIFSYNFT